MLQALKDHHPQQQGLRRRGTVLYISNQCSQRPSSTTTRIKTLSTNSESSEYRFLKDHHPQQQGLRL